MLCRGVMPCAYPREMEEFMKLNECEKGRTYYVKRVLVAEAIGRRLEDFSTGIGDGLYNFMDQLNTIDLRGALRHEKE